MVFRFDEKTGSRRHTTNPPSYEVRYTAAGEPSSALVKTYAKAAVPLIVATDEGLLYRQDVSIEEQGFALFQVTANYAQQKREQGQVTFGFQTTGGNFHITHSKSTVAKYPNDAVSHKQAIGVRKNGTSYDIDGADIIIPALKLTYGFRHPAGIVNEAFAAHLASLTGKVNSAAFRGFEPGEVLLLGCQGSDGTDAEAEVNYEFACEKNLQGLIIGSITGIDKNGHDLLWVESKPVAIGGKPAVEPLAVYVERVYDRVNFAAELGWG